MPKWGILTLSLYQVVSPFPPERNPSKSLKIPLLRQRTAIGLLHDDFILLPRPESFKNFFLLQIRAFFIYTSQGLPNLKKERKNEKNSNHSSKISNIIGKVLIQAII